MTRSVEDAVEFARVRMSPKPEHLALLVELSSIEKKMIELRARREELIDECIAVGHSERAIGQAAGISGPAINQRKKRGHS